MCVCVCVFTCLSSLTTTKKTKKKKGAASAVLLSSQRRVRQMLKDIAIANRAENVNHAIYGMERALIDVLVFSVLQGPLVP